MVSDMSAGMQNGHTSSLNTNNIDWQALIDNNVAGGGNPGNTGGGSGAEVGGMPNVNLDDLANMLDMPGGQAQANGSSSAPAFDQELFAGLADMMAANNASQNDQARQSRELAQMLAGKPPWGTQPSSPVIGAGQQDVQSRAAPSAPGSANQQSLLSRRLQQYKGNADGAGNSLPNASHIRSAASSRPGSSSGMPETSVLPTPPASFTSTFAYPPGHLNRRPASGWAPDRGVGRSAQSNLHMQLERASFARPQDTPQLTPSSSEAGQKGPLDIRTVRLNPFAGAGWKRPLT